VVLMTSVYYSEQEEEEDYPFPLTLKAKKSPGGHSPIDGNGTLNGT
jgi:hypothetical protein